MSRLLWVAGAASVFTLVGCLEGNGAVSPASASVSSSYYATPTTDTQNYGDGSPLMTSSEDESSRAFELELMALINNHRVSIGLNALLEDEALGELARAHSKDMAMDGYFDHVDQSQNTVAERADLAGLSGTYGAFGENIAGGYGTPQEVFAAWLASWSHRETIERPDVTRIGAGFFQRYPDPSRDALVYYATAVVAAR